MKFDSLAMIETNGLVAALVAINKMLSFGNVEFLRKEVIPNGQVTVFIIGKSSEIKRVLNGGIIAAQKVGVVISAGIVPYPNDVIENIVLESTTVKSKPKRAKRINKKEEEKIDTLFDQVEDETSFNELIAEVVDNNPDVAGEKLSIMHQEHALDVDGDESSKHVNNSDDILKNELETDVDTSKQILKQSMELIETQENGTDYNEEIEDKKEDNKTVTGKDSEIDKREDEGLENTDTLEEIYNENIEKIEEEETAFEGMSHIERLRAEAKSEIETEIDDDSGASTFPEVSLPNDETPNVPNLTDDTSEKNIDSKLVEMNVPELRKLARSREDFPIKGREISKANRKVLLEYFNKLI